MKRKRKQIWFKDFGCFKPVSPEEKLLGIIFPNSKIVVFTNYGCFGNSFWSENVVLLLTFLRLFIGPRSLTQ